MNVRGIVLVGLVGIAILLAVAVAGVLVLGGRTAPPAPPPAASSPR